MRCVRRQMCGGTVRDPRSGGRVAFYPKLHVGREYGSFIEDRTQYGTRVARVSSCKLRHPVADLRIQVKRLVAKRLTMHGRAREFYMDDFVSVNERAHLWQFVQRYRIQTASAV